MQLSAWQRRAALSGVARLAPQEDAVITDIERRISRVTQLPELNGEGIQILHYVDGQKYEPHNDYFFDSVNQAPELGGQRVATVLMYLCALRSLARLRPAPVCTSVLNASVLHCSTVCVRLLATSASLRFCDRDRPMRSPWAGNACDPLRSPRTCLPWRSLPACGRKFSASGPLLLHERGLLRCYAALEGPRWSCVIPGRGCSMAACAVAATSACCGRPGCADYCG